jgi:hypothetical protein
MNKNDDNSDNNSVDKEELIYSNRRTNERTSEEVRIEDDGDERRRVEDNNLSQNIINYSKKVPYVGKINNNQQYMNNMKPSSGYMSKNINGISNRNQPINYQ